jgi:hypothetical protein
MGDLARAHGHRALRVSGVVLVVVALLAGIGGTIRYFEGSPTQALTPENVDRLTPAWTAEAGPGPVPGVATSVDALFVSSADGLLAYPLPCEPGAKRTCAPAWSAAIPDGPLSTPTANGGAVFAGSAQGRVYAFPASCDAAQCRPLWNGVAGNGPVSTPGVNDDFVYVTSGKLYAFPATCGTNDRTCPPAWVGEIPGRGASGRPAVGAGLVVVTSATQQGGVAAFPAVCLDPCRPVWMGETGGPATAVTLSQDTAYVVARGELMAFSLSCRSTCRPAWTATIQAGRPATAGALGAPTVDGGQVYIGGADGTLWAFPDGCAESTCPATRTWALGSLPLLTPVIQDDVIYVASSGGVLNAIPLGCVGASPGCDSPWSEPLGTSTSGSPDATSDGVYLGDDAGIVHAFTVPSGP